MPARERLSITAHVALIVAACLIWLAAVVLTVGHVGSKTCGFTLYDTAPYVVFPIDGLDTAGIVSFDRVLSVDERPVLNRSDLNSYIAALSPGTSVRLSIERQGGKVEGKTVHVQRFSWLAFVINCLPLLVVAVGHILVGAFAFAASVHNKAARAHLRLTGIIGIWLSVQITLDLTERQQVWELIAMPFVGAAGLELALLFPVASKVLQRWPWLTKAPYGFALAMHAVAIVAVVPASRQALGLSPVFLYLEWAIGTMLYGFVGLSALLFSTYRKMKATPSALVQTQARITLAGAALAYGPYAVYYLFWGIPGAYFGQPPSAGVVAALAWFFVLFPVSVAYAIARHRLFDIEVLIKRSLVYGSVTALLAGAFVMVSAGVRGVAEPFMGESSVPDVLASAGVVLFFGPLKEQMQRIVDRAFHRVTYDFRGVVTEFANRVREVVDQATAIAVFQDLVGQALKPAYVTVLGPGAGSGVGSDAMLISLGRREVESIALGPKLSEDPYLPEDQELVRHLGQHLDMALENARLFAKAAQQQKLEHELQIARNVQEGLLPKRLPDLPDLDVSAASRPAGQVGGDLYDMVDLGDGRVGVLIGDVAGKGVPAALLMSSSLAVFRTSGTQARSPSAFMAMLNQHVCDHGPGGTSFVAACYGIREGRTLRLTNAGMPKPLLNGRPVDATGLPAGLLPGHRYEERTLELSPGDSIVFFSDGWSDALNPAGERFEQDRLEALAMRHAFLSASGQVAAFLAELDRWIDGAEPADDRTVVVIKLKEC